ncbi:MAG: hypothetical protein ACRD1E_05050, partial [Terriglobales bacterium]
THDYGQTWTKITSGLPHTQVSYAHCVIEDPTHQGLLYLGTEGGAYVSFNDGGEWQPLQMNLPHAPVYWLTVQNRRHDLVAATYGRGFWILDNLLPLEQFTPEVAASEAHLFAPRSEYRFRGGVSPISPGYEPSAGENAPGGAAIDYFLKTAVRGQVAIKVLDAAGKLVATVPGAGRAGINRVYWNLRNQPSPTVRLRTLSPYAPDQTLNAQGWRAAPNSRPLTIMAPPGNYTVELTAGGTTQKQSLTLLKDPHSDGTAADIAAQTKLAESILDEYNRVTGAINQIEVIRAQLATVSESLGADASGPAAVDNAAAVAKSAAALDAKLVTVESDLYNTKATGKGEDQWRWAPTLIDKLSYLESEVTSSDFAPTEQQAAVSTELAQEVASHRTRLDQLVNTDVAAFNASLREKKIPNVIAGGGQ